MHRARNLTTFQVKHGRHTRLGMCTFTIDRCEGGNGLARSCMYMPRAGILIIFSHQLVSYSMYLCHISFQFGKAPLARMYIQDDRLSYLTTLPA